MALFKRRASRGESMPPAGWNPASDRRGFYRWWDGARWTDQYHPMSEEAPEIQSPLSRVDPSAAVEQPPAKTTAQKAVSPWAKATVWQQVVGENNYGPAFKKLLRKNRGRSDGYGTEFDGLAATAVAEPNNKYDAFAVAVRVQGELVGYLPRDAAQFYSPALQDLAERGEVLAVQARVWVAPKDDANRVGSVTVMLPPPNGVQAFNEPPEEAHQILPHGGAIQVTGEDQHMDVLGRYISDGERYLAVTLHVVEEQKTERSQPYQCVEVRLDGHRVGVLTKAMSEKLADVVQYIAERGKVPVCRAVLKGSPLRAELVLYVAKSHEVTRRWLDAVDDGGARA